MPIAVLILSLEVAKLALELIKTDVDATPIELRREVIRQRFEDIEKVRAVITQVLGNLKLDG